MTAESAPAGAAGQGRALALALVTGGALVILAVLAVAVRRPTAGPRPGDQAPTFAFETFDGEAIDLAALRGQVVVVNFWASWCRECEIEAADLEAVWRDYRERGVTVLGIGYTDTRPAALEYIERHGVTYPSGPDRAAMISRQYRLTGVPETLVIDQAGRIVPLTVAGRERGKIIGPIAPGATYTPADLRALIDRLLAGEGA